MTNNHINYVEFKTLDLQETKRFYNNCFNWNFTDYGDSYIAFNQSGLEGGFELTHQPITKGVLIVLYHTDLEAIKSTVLAEGGKIVQDIFEFPGGKRFHFEDPSGNELAIWSE